VTIFICVLIVVGGIATTATDSGAVRKGGAVYYIALGDSLAAGFQPIGRPEDDHRTQMGYTDQLWLIARQWYPNLELVNLGCPGASTASMAAVDERCPYPHGSQLDEALAVIEANHDDLAFITIDIGFSDFDCQTGIECLFPGIDNIRARLPNILATLRQAAPGTPIIGMNIYDPLLASWLDGDEGFARMTVAAVRIVNETLEEIYLEAGMPVADVEGAFATSDFETMVPLGDHGLVPRNVALVCLRTWNCVAPPLGPDRHPNVLGFRVIAEALAAQLRLLRPLSTGEVAP
jgi:lysophospholipase L1-like esterase